MQKKKKTAVRGKKVVRAKKAAPTSPATLAGALNAIERMLLNEDYAEDLADILSALRGPDSSNIILKSQTTSCIRGLAFPKVAKKLARGYSSIQWAVRLNKAPMCAGQEWDAAEPHFVNHIDLAIAALKRAKRLK